MKGAILNLTLTVACAVASAADNNVARSYDCIRAAFSEQNPPPAAIARDVGLTASGIKRLSGAISDPMRKAIIFATVAAQGKMDQHIGESYEFSYYSEFVSSIGDGLAKNIDIGRCDSAETDLNSDVLYDVSINHYIAGVVGKGDMHQWFLSNGGDYIQSSFVAMLIGFELTGRRYDMEKWKRFYIRHVNEKYHTHPSE